ncbi:MAG TPA: ABC transporter permease subunit [Clostridiaceae bacterium]|nr:ABC transporter permease subunit [Clostridiaceae bacterium]
MNKVFILLRNEWTKILRKKIVYIILILTIMGIIALGGIFKLFSYSYYEEDQIAFTETKNEMEREIFNIEKEISDLEQQIESIEKNNKSDQSQDLLNLHTSLASLKHYKIMLELGLAKNINIFSSDYRRELISDLADLQLAKESILADYQKADESVLAYETTAEEIVTGIDEADTIGSSSSEPGAKESSLDGTEDPSDFERDLTESNDYSPAEKYATDLYQDDSHTYEEYTGLPVDAIEQKINNLDQIIEQDSYAAFIDYQINHVKSNQSLNEKQKEIRISDLELELRVNPGGKPNYPGKYFFLSLQNIRNNALTAMINGYTSSYSPLLPIELEEAKQDYLVTNFYLNLPITDPPATDHSIYNYPGLAIHLGTYAIICLIIILGGSTISQEISTGSIKGLIIAPVKRYKIFFAKVLSILSISLIGMLIVYLTTLISSYAFVEPFYRLPYAFTIGNNVAALQFPVYLLLLSLSKVSFVFITGTIALMFSGITRSTSISVGITMVLQFGLLGVYNFIKLISVNLHPIITFLPFEYLDLSKYIFPAINDNSYSIPIFSGGYSNQEFVLRSPASIPYIYWFVMVVCFIWIAGDSFVKNDL